MKEIILKVEGMVCVGCENRVKKSLQTIKKIRSVNADYQTGIVSIECEVDIDENNIKQRIDDIGFKVIEEE